MEKKLENIISRHAYDELKEKVIEQVGEKASEYIFPAVKKALEEGDGVLREELLSEWLNVDSMRVCSECGAIMEEGWYLNCAGYACSDECAAKNEGISMEEFECYQIYKDDIIEWLQDNDDPRSIDQLSKEECAAIIEEVADDREYYWTEWY